MNMDELGTTQMRRQSTAPSPVASWPWRLSSRGLTVVHGGGEAARLSHYFLPEMLMEGQRVLFLDGANCADPRRIARFARERGGRFEQFSRQIRIARAFTCFQLTELTARVPRFLRDFAAQAVVVTALPDLYFDDDVRDWDARVSFEQALQNLERWVRLPIPLTVFSDAGSFTPPAARRRFFEQLTARASEVWRFQVGTDSRFVLTRERASARLPSQSVSRGV